MYDTFLTGGLHGCNRFIRRCCKMKNILRQRPVFGVTLITRSGRNGERSCQLKRTDRYKFGLYPDRYADCQ